MLYRSRNLRPVLDALEHKTLMSGTTVPLATTSVAVVAYQEPMSQPDPDYTSQQPATVIVNGVPYTPTRVYPLPPEDAAVPPAPYPYVYPLVPAPFSPVPTVPTVPALPPARSPVTTPVLPTPDPALPAFPSPIPTTGVAATTAQNPILRAE